MAIFAPVAPIQVLEDLKKVKQLGNSHLLLTHHILEYPDRFIALFDGVEPSTLILDNSVVELGDAATDEKVWEACEVLMKCNPDGPRNYHWIHPVLRDVMGDSAGTIAAATESYAFWDQKNRSLGRVAMALMVVLQGNDWGSFLQTTTHFLDKKDEFPFIQVAGIPRVLTEYLGTRERAVKYVKGVRPDINIHLLGFSDDVPDDLICCNRPEVMSIDSAVPLRVDGNWTPTMDAGKRPADWFETAQATNQMVDNLIKARHLCG